jgi:hypothetical protein
MGNFFSSAPFLEASARFLFPGAGARAGTVELGGRCFDALLLPDGSLLDNPMSDFLEPLGPELGTRSAVRPARFLPRVALQRVALGPEREETPGLEPSPCIDWRDFDSWEDYVQRTSARDWRAFKVTRRRRRKLARTLGPLRLELASGDHRLVEQALIHKARQLRRTGRLDRFASRRVRLLVHHLVEQGELSLAVLWAGSRPTAFALAHWGEQRLYSWITSYDPELSACSPGTLLYEDLMEASYDRGHREFDFLIGAEPYKYHYATHERLVGPLGDPSWTQRTAGGLRTALEADRRPRRLRRLAWELARGGAQRRVQSEPPVEADPETLAAVEEHAAGWPELRLLQRDDCQIAVLSDRLPDDGDPLRLTRLTARRALRKGGVQLRRGGRWLRGEGPDEAAEGEPLRLKPGDWVRIRSLEEIRASLVDGTCGGLGWRVEAMARHCGEAFQVRRGVGSYFHQGQQRVVQPVDGVSLEGLRCDGAPAAARGGCDRGCELFWSEAWLERAEAPSGVPEPLDPGSLGAGRRVRVRSLEAIRAIERDSPDASGLRFAEATMAAFCARSFEVAREVRRIWEPRGERSLPLEGVITLVGVSCVGAELLAAGRCDRRCALLWREAWLEREEG